MTPDEVLALARKMHDDYERWAPDFGYATREDTRQFDPESPNGRLMLRVVSALIAEVEARTLERAAQVIVDGNYGWIEKEYFDSLAEEYQRRIRALKPGQGAA